MKKQVVVIGLGRFGSNVVKSFYNLGHDVLAIDKNEDRVQIIMGQASYALSGDATNEMVLRDLGIQIRDLGYPNPGFGHSNLGLGYLNLGLV